MSTEDPFVDTIETQAAYWTVRVHDDALDAEARLAFERWVAADERHGREFRLHSATISLAAELPPAAQSRIVAFGKHAAGAPWYLKMRHPRRLALAAAAALALFAVSGWFVARPALFAPAPFVTGTGQNRTVTFEDGSVAYLNTQTRLKWLGGDRRRVELLAGEALFDVAHDASRPFTVVVEDSEIRVLGTRFNVYRKKAGDVVVTVLEGAVQVREKGASAPDERQSVWQRDVRANERLAYNQSGLMSDVHTTTALNAVKWREGVLELADEPLPGVLEELTRYTDQRIVIGDARLAQLRLGGALSIRDVRAALSRIEKLAPVTVTESGGMFTLNYRSESSRKN